MRAPCLRLVLLTCALASAAVASAQEGAGPIAVGVGEHAVLRRDTSIERIAVGNPAIADVEAISTSEVLVLGKAPGSTTLVLWTGGHGETIPVVVRSTGRELGARIESLGEPALEIGPGGELTGRARSLRGLAAAREMAAAEGAGTPDASELGFDTQVQIDLKIVELSRQRLRQAGVQLLRNTSGSAHALSPPGTLSGVIGEGAAVKDQFEGFIFQSASGFLPLANAFNLVATNTSSGFVGILSLLESKGWAHTLAEPTLVTTSGKSASFLAGGEFPIPVAQGGSGDSATISIEYREFGVRIDLRPTVLSADHIVLSVAPEVSELDFSAGVTSGGVTVPALTTRRVDTTVELGDGESFVIGGLINQRTAGAVERVPGLGRLPVLGPFFRRVRHSREEREVIMIVSVHLVRALAPGTEPPSLPGARHGQFDPTLRELILGGRTEPAPGGTGFGD
jgi:pilus assembly protein CpaC